MKSVFIVALSLSFPFLCLAEKMETQDPQVLHAIGVMIELKLKPKEVVKVLSGTWQQSDQPLSCVYFKKGKVEKVAIAAVGQVKVVSAGSQEVAALCYPAADMTAPVKFFAPSYLD